jgi:hypothetical protein
VKGSSFLDSVNPGKFSEHIFTGLKAGPGGTAGDDDDRTEKDPDRIGGGGTEGSRSQSFNDPHREHPSYGEIKKSLPEPDISTGSNGYGLLMICTVRCGKGISMPSASKASLMARVMSNLRAQ